MRRFDVQAQDGRPELGSCVAELPELASAAVPFHKCFNSSGNVSPDRLGRPMVECDHFPAARMPGLPAQVAAALRGAVMALPLLGDVHAGESWSRLGHAEELMKTHGDMLCKCFLDIPVGSMHAYSREVPLLVVLHITI